MIRALGIVLACALSLGGCEREARRFVNPVRTAHPVTKAEGLADLQPGQAGPGMQFPAATGGYNEGSAYEVSQGKQWFRWYNCVGCHAQGGGAIGPALMDDSWIYGSKPEDIFATIMDGRPNGMPAFRGRVTEQQAWQLAAYVRSMSGLLSADVAPNRSDSLYGAPPESRRKPTSEDEKKK
jgi:cytochrome c oxidase cbb3-type subunit III